MAASLSGPHARRAKDRSVGLALANLHRKKKNKGEARALIWMEGRLPVAAGGGRGEPEHTRQHLEPGPVKFKEAGPLHTIKTLIPQKSADADAFTGGCSTNGSAETAQI